MSQVSTDSSYVYGPVPSRRLGQSLGVDPIPFKTCNYSCVYCQLGRTTPLACERAAYVAPEKLLTQVHRVLETHGQDSIDYVSLVGQGEPTLNAALGRVIDGIAAMTKIPIAVITNGALLSTGQVRDELTGADIVMPSLDAADEEVFRHVNRPCPRLHIDEIIEGLSMFSRIFEGRLWVEVMLCKGLNDDQASLQSLRDGLDQIAPDRVQINVPVRPPAEAWVEIPDHEAIVHATSLLGDVAEVVSPYDGSFSLEGSDSPMDAVLAIIRRHPIREVRLLETLERYSDKEVEDVLLDLEQSGRARQRVHYGEVFWESTQVRAEE